MCNELFFNFYFPIAPFFFAPLPSPPHTNVEKIKKIKIGEIPTQGKKIILVASAVKKDFAPLRMFGGGERRGVFFSFVCLPLEEVFIFLFFLVLEKFE